MVKKRKINQNILHKSIEQMPQDIRSILISLAFFLFLFIPVLNNFSFESGNRIALPIPGMMSIVPTYSIEAEFGNVTLGRDLSVKIKLCGLNECVTCPNCTFDLFYQFETDKQIYLTNISLDNESSALINIKTNPTWLFITINEIGIDWLRIPKATLFENIYETSTKFTNKLATFETWAWLLTGLWVIYSLIVYLIRTIKEIMSKKEKPEYIG